MVDRYYYWHSVAEIRQAPNHNYGNNAEETDFVE